MKSEVKLFLHGEDLKSEETLSYITDRQTAGGEALNSDLLKDTCSTHTHTHIHTSELVI